jgi:hypothetical protein
MSKAVVFSNYGEVEVLKIADVQIGELGQDDILIKQEERCCSSEHGSSNYHNLLSLKIQLHHQQSLLRLLLLPTIRFK